MITIYDTINKVNTQFSVAEACQLIDGENPYLLVGICTSPQGIGSIYVADELLQDAVQLLTDDCNDLVIKTNDDETYYTLDAYRGNSAYHVQMIKLDDLIFEEYGCWQNNEPTIFARLKTEKEFWHEILKLMKIRTDI